jgi:small basic protein
MLYLVAFVIGLVIAWAAIRFVPRVRRALFPIPTVPVIDDPELLLAVRTLHQSLFAGLGLNVSSFFNSVWIAADLEANGVPDIEHGRPR